MNLKLRGRCFGVLLLSAIATITALSAGRPEPTAALLLPDPPSTPHGESSGGSTTTSIEPPSSREDEEPLHSMTAEEGSVSPPGEQESNSSAAGRPGKRLKPRMVLSASHGAFPKPKKAAGEWIFSLHSPPHGNCSKGKIKHVVQGKFYITGHLETNVQSLGYQSDAAASAQPRRGRPRVRGQRVSSPEESWQKLQPVVECGDGFMTLTVRKRRAIQLLLDRENESSVPLSQLSPQCGYSVQTSWRDLSLKAQYDACHVTQEDGNFVLPLLWRGAPVRMSCPVSKIKPGSVGPSSLCCSPYGMTVKVPGLSSTDEHRVNVRGEWTPLVLLAEQCGYTLDRQGAETVIAAPFVTCGITIKDGKYTLTVETGNEVFLLACPISPLEELPFTYQPVLSPPPHLTPGSAAPMPGSLEPSPWAPPFYLAPPHYPHPTFHHGHVHSEVQDTPNAPTPQASSPEATSSPRSVPPLYEEYEDHFPLKIRPGDPYEYLKPRSFLPSKDEVDDSSRSNPEPKREPKTQSKEPLIVGLSEKQRSAPTGFPTQVEAPRFRAPSHDFSPYYHYYHHPKIPLPSTPPQDPDTGQEVPREPSVTRFDAQKRPAMQESDVNSERLLSPVHKSPNAYVHHANAPLVPKSFAHDASVPPPLQPYPYYYFYYFPHSARGEAKRLPVLHPDKADKAASLDNHALPHSPVAAVPHQPNTKPHIPGSSEDLISKSGNDGPVLAADDVKPELEDDGTRPSPAEPPAVQQSPPNGPEQPSRPAFSYHPNPYQYYYHHPFNDYYLMYYGPEGLFSVYDGVPPSSPRTLAHQRRDSSFPLQTPVYKPQTKTAATYDFQSDQLNPYFYYYHRYDQPQQLGVHRESRPAGGGESKASSNSEPSQRADFEYSSLEWFVHEAGRPSVPLPRHSPLPGLNPQQGAQQQPQKPVAQSEVKQLDSPVEERPKANTHPPPAAPPASPCGFGPESHPECGNAVDCCVHAVQDCTVGQYFVFVVPDSVVEPTVVSTAHSPEDSNASCTLQRLTSDLDIYIVPLDGCGVNRHMFGDTVLHLLEVQGVHPYQDIDSAHQILPVRLTVGCSSSPEFPGEVMFHVMDQLPPPPQRPAAVSVRLRIATDKSFTSYYPEAHLPLSLLRSRPVYVEVGLLDPSEPNLLLLVHSCLAYTRDPYASWMLVYDGCQPHGAAQLLPSPNSHHIRRISVFSFLPLPPDSRPPTAKGGRLSFLDDPEIFFMCLTEVCSATDHGCSLSCFKGPSGDTRMMK